MARPRKSGEPPKQGPPVAFRAGPELAQAVAAFAESRKIGVHDAFKNLAALAAVGLDVRYYDLVAELAARTSGLNPFVRAALRVHAALVAAARVEPRYAFDPARTLFVVDTVQLQVAEAGGNLPVEIVRTLFDRLGIKVPGAAGHETASEESEFHSTDYGRSKDASKIRIERQ